MPRRNNNFSQNRIRQAKLTVNALLGGTVLSGIAILFGVSLAISGDIPEGLQMAETGMVATVELAKQLKDANERLDQITKDAIDQEPT